MNARRLIHAQLLTLDNELRGILRLFGIELGTARRRNFAEHALAAVEGRDGLVPIIQPMLAARAGYIGACSSSCAAIRRAGG